MKIVVALGGNALGNTPEEQKKAVKQTAMSVVDLIESGHEVILVHGNGPQVGMINLAMEVGAKYNDKVPNMPLVECGAMSQGYIGYHLQNAFKNELMRRKMNKNVSSIVTQVVVDKADPAFLNPSKPIGSFYTKEEADQLAKEKGYTMIEDSGRGYRRVVPSPKPIDIVEKDTIKTLFDHKELLIASGGGGIPVIVENNEIKGIDAVIDKDLASSKLAELIEADIFIVLTAVPKIAINFGKPNQRNIDKMSTKEAYQFIEEGHFAPGSMLPKVLAAIDFVTHNQKAQAIIGSLEEASDAIKGKSGTLVYYQ
jgi:carbamate kinase